MNKPTLYTYNPNPQQPLPPSLITSDGINENPSSFCSPFRKHLPIIFQTENSPHKSFPSDRVERVDYLQSQYESRLIAVQESLFGSGVDNCGTIPNDSQVLTGREKTLLSKIYEKEKELVILEDRLYLLKNTNECLRETIKEDQGEKMRLQDEIQQLRQENTQLQQRLSNITQPNNIHHPQQSISVNASLASFSSPTPLQSLQDQQHIFFTSPSPCPDFQPTSTIHSLIKQNALLRTEIQSLKSFYQEEIYGVLQQKDRQVHEVEGRLRLVEKEVQEWRNRCEEKENGLEVLGREKREMLGYYLKLIEEMKAEMEVGRNVAMGEDNGMGDGVVGSRRHDVQENVMGVQETLATGQKPIQESLLVQRPNNNNFCLQSNDFPSHHQHPNQNYSTFLINNDTVNINDITNKSIDMNRDLIRLQAENQVLKGLVVSGGREQCHGLGGNMESRNQSRSKSKSVRKSGSSASLLLNATQQSIGGRYNLESNPRLNATFIQGGYMPTHRHTNRVSPHQKYRQQASPHNKIPIRPSPNHRSTLLSPPSASLPLNQPVTTFLSKQFSSTFTRLPQQRLVSPFYKNNDQNEKRREIDKRLDELKFTLTRQITYS